MPLKNAPKPPPRVIRYSSRILKPAPAAGGGGGGGTTLTVTATQGGTTANGMLLRVFVLTGAAAAASQTGATSATFKAVTTTFTNSITTTQAGSRVYGAAEPQSNGLGATAAAATTLVDNVDDNANADTYASFKATSLTGTPGATTLGLALTSSAQGPIVMLEVLASGTLAEDGSSPAAASTTSATTVSTASFTAPGGSLLVALIAADGGTGVETMTVSGGSLTWTEKVKQNASGQDYAGVWIADVPGTAAGLLPQQLHIRAYTAPAATTAAAAYGR